MAKMRCFHAFCAVFLAMPLAHAEGQNFELVRTMLPGIAITFLPAAALEAWVFARALKLPWRRALKLSLLAKSGSSMIAIPFVWIALLLVLFVLALVSLLLFGESHGSLLDPWLKTFAFFVLMAPAPTCPEYGYCWTVPASALVMLVWFFVASYMFEARALQRLTRGEFNKALTDRTALRANMLVYALLWVLTAAWLLVPLFKRGWPWEVL